MVMADTGFPSLSKGVGVGQGEGVVPTQYFAKIVPNPRKIKVILLHKGLGATIFMGMKIFMGTC